MSEKNTEQLKFSKKVVARLTTRNQVNHISANQDGLVFYNRFYIIICSEWSGTELKYFCSLISLSQILPTSTANTVCFWLMLHGM